MSLTANISSPLTVSINKGLTLTNSSESSAAVMTLGLSFLPGSSIVIAGASFGLAAAFIRLDSAGPNAVVQVSQGQSVTNIGEFDITLNGEPLLPGETRLTVNPPPN